MNPPCLLLVDGHAYAYRSFHAIRALNAPTGAPTNAIFGFIKALGKLRARLEPTHLLVVWDGGLAAERLADLPAYKAQRPPMPPALEAQLDPLTHWLQARGLASFCEDGVEADDWIATVARRAAAEGATVVIASADKDFMQLVEPQIGLLNPNDKTESIWTAADVEAKTGVAPRQIVDWLALIGDHVDNIPGVPGVGPKTATELLRRAGSIEGLFQDLAAVKSEKVRAALAASRDLLDRNRRLIRLRDDLPGASELVDYVPRAPEVGRLRALYEGWGFRGMLRELDQSAAVAQPELF